MPVASVVDYDAWRKGYLPPSEHVLIDALSYRGATVVQSSCGGEFSYWFVVKQDAPLTKKQRRSMLAHLRMMIEEIESADDLPADQADTASEDKGDD